MRIAMEGYYGSKQPCLGESKYFALTLQPKGVGTSYSLTDNKPHKSKVKPEITLGYSSYRWSRARKVGDKLYFGEIRKPSITALQVIESYEQQILLIQQQKQSFLNEHFMEWDFLTLNEVIEIMKQKKPTKEYVEYIDTNLPIVLHDLGWD